MNEWQQLFLLGFGLFNVGVVGKGWLESTRKKNVYHLTPWLYWLGIFVWGDALAFGVFWALAALLSWFLNDWVLFLLLVSLFWLVRSVGETIYWLAQQFSTVVRYPLKKLPLYPFFGNDSVWFIYQTICQVVTIVSIVLSLYFAKLWLAG